NDIHAVWVDIVYRVVSRIYIRRERIILLSHRIDYIPPSNDRIVQPRAVVVELQSVLQLLAVVKIVVFRGRYTHVFSICQTEGVVVGGEVGHGDTGALC